jgi:exosortase
MTKSLRHFDFVSLCVLSLILWWHPLVSTLELALRKDEYTQILLILPISAALIYLEWRSGNAQPEPNFRSGSVLLLLAVLVGLVGTRWWGPAVRPPDIQLFLSMLALVTWWIGSFVAGFGTSVFRMYAFPLYFLLWLVPFPQFALSHIVSFLQHGSASAAHLLFAAVGVPVTQDGFALSIPGLTIEVTKECSSIRSSTLLWVTTMVLAQLLLRSPWRKALVIVTAIPLAVMKNGLRIFAIAVLATRVDRGFMIGKLHHDGGIVFFMISLLVVFALLWILRRGEAPVLPAPALRPVSPQGLAGNID